MSWITKLMGKLGATENNSEQVEELRQDVDEIQETVSALSDQVSTVERRVDSAGLDRVEEIDRRVSKLSRRVEQLEPDTQSTDDNRSGSSTRWGNKNRLDVQTTVELVDALGGFTDTEELLTKAQNEISEDIVHQTISKCIIEGRNDGVLDYDKSADPTRVWTPGNRQ